MPLHILAQIHTHTHIPHAPARTHTHTHAHRHTHAHTRTHDLSTRSEVERYFLEEGCDSDPTINWTCDQCIGYRTVGVIPDKSPII